MCANLHVLLIGVDYYVPNASRLGGRFASLGSSVRDVLEVERFLATELANPPTRIVKLTSSRGSNGPVEPPETLPSHSNIVRAFRELGSGAVPGDQIYIHFSGHGARVPTVFVKEKGPDAFDEALVPFDIGTQSEYLRDRELTSLLQEMVDRDIFVTVVLDCCHSGGVMEWAEDPHGYVFLAACRPHELAYEHPFAGGESQGALTFWFLEALRYGGILLTYKQIYQRILAKAHNQTWLQTPILIGESERIVFGTDRVVWRDAVTVLSVEATRLLLDAGQAHGIRPGMRFALHSTGPEDKQVGDRLAVVEIREVHAADSWAEMVETTQTLVEQGAQVLLMGLRSGPGVLRLQSVVRVIFAGKGSEAPVVERLRRAILQEPSGFLRLANAEEPVEYQVVVDEEGRLEIWDGRGVPVSNLPRSVSGKVEEVLQRLVHLTRYRNIKALNNSDETSPLAGKLGLVLGTQRGFIKGDKPNPLPLMGLPPYEIHVGEWLFLTIVNHSAYPLNVVVLDLAPDWSITQVFPGKGGPAFWTLDGGAERQVQIKSSLADGCEEGIDVLKAIATLGPANFRWLELPALGCPNNNAMEGGTPKSSFDRLFAWRFKFSPGTRNFEEEEAYASEQWTTVQVELRVRRLESRK